MITNMKLLSIVFSFSAVLATTAAVAIEPVNKDAQQFSTDFDITTATFCKKDQDCDRQHEPVISAGSIFDEDC